MSADNNDGAFQLTPEQASRLRAHPYGHGIKSVPYTPGVTPPDELLTKMGVPLHTGQEAKRSLPIDDRGVDWDAYDKIMKSSRETAQSTSTPYTYQDHQADDVDDAELSAVLAEGKDKHVTDLKDYSDVNDAEWRSAEVKERLVQEGAAIASNAVLDTLRGQAEAHEATARAARRDMEWHQSVVDEKTKVAEANTKLAAEFRRTIALMVGQEDLGE